MTFAHPVLLTLITLAGVPIAIHLLSGRWAPVEPWAAMRFLTTVTPTRRRSVLRDRLVLAARMAALALAAIAVAGPRAVNVGAGLAPDDPPTLHVVVLDDSLSTARPRGDGPAFAALQNTALDLTENAGPADRFVLVRTAKADPATGPPRMIGPLGASEFRRNVAAAEPLHTAGDVPAAFAAAAELLEDEADRFPRTRIALVTDRAAADWGGSAVAAGVECLQTAARGANAVQWLGPGGPGPAGRTLAGISASAGDPDSGLNAVPRVGTAATLIAAVRSYGPRPAGAVAFFVNDRFVGRVPLPAAAAEDLAPEETSAELPVTFETVGPARVEARLEDEPGPRALTSRFAVVPVRGPLRVLVAADAALSADGPAGDPGFYLDQALSADGGTFAVERTAFDRLPTLDLARFEAIACAGAPPPPAAAALRAYLEAGGGAFVALRPTDDPAELRALFAGPLGGLTVGPAEGVADPTDPAATGFTFEFEAEAFGSAPLAAVSGPRGGLAVGFRRLEPAASPTGGAWPMEVAAQFVDETGRSVAPAALTANGPAGGRAAVLATSVDATWGGPWPAAGASFVPLVRGLVAFVALPPPSEPATTGDTLKENIAPGQFARAVRVRRPDGSERLAPVADGAARFTDTDEPGFYRLLPETAGEPAGADEQPHWIAVNAPPTEADPRPAAVPETAAPKADTPTAIAESRSLSAWVWAAALAALLIEPALARGRRPSRPATPGASGVRRTGRARA